MREPNRTGEDQAAGSYACTNCGELVTVGSADRLPACPVCHNTKWRPAEEALKKR